MISKIWNKGINQRSANGGKPYSVPPLPSQRSRWSPVGGYPSVEEQIEQQRKFKPMPNKWIKLTRPDDKPIWFSVDQIMCVESTLDAAPGSNSTIHTLTGMHRFVKETVDEVEKML